MEKEVKTQSQSFSALANLERIAAQALLDSPISTAAPGLRAEQIKNKERDLDRNAKLASRKLTLFKFSIGDNVGVKEGQTTGGIGKVCGIQMKEGMERPQYNIRDAETGVETVIDEVLLFLTGAISF